MVNISEFDDIRPYNDDELPQVYEELAVDPTFQKVVGAIFPDTPFEALVEKMRTCKTKDEFQTAFSYDAVWYFGKFSDGVTLDHSLLPLNKETAYTYITNHRDIILDAGFLSVLLMDLGMPCVEIAIGDNLLIYPWIKKFVRINKAFIVQRAPTVHQMLESSACRSQYIHYTIGTKKQSVWIAQREGRAKDSDDRTQESVIKMLTLGGTGEIIDRLIELNIAPVAISYEYDPCDYLKAREYQQKRDSENYKKTTEEDLLSMQSGLFGYKGKVHFQVTGCINEELMQLDSSLPKGELFTCISALIDRHIHRNYRLYPGNYIAYDMLNKVKRFAGQYTQEDYQKFESYIEKQLDKIDLPNKDIPFLREKMLAMYANPLVNYLSAQQHA
ncbi:hypothetical protein EZS27_025694 [termite gut metagenome]|uniref:Phospholipid/glycerol acyltransferase domain-containing protein n=1 Tax=termite gut metagenome TaxID=433724 RepID=A0A5J4QT26_9ZZZZ